VLQAAEERGQIARQQAVHDIQPRNGRRRLDKVVNPPAARQPPQLIVEQADEQEAEPEHGERTADERKDPHQMIGQAIACEGGPDARRDADQQRDEQRGQG
jgi:hypothetical protein